MKIKNSFFVKHRCLIIVRIDLMFSNYSHDHIALDAMNIMANGQYIDRFMTKNRKFDDSASCLRRKPDIDVTSDEFFFNIDAEKY